MIRNNAEVEMVEVEMVETEMVEVFIPSFYKDRNWFRPRLKLKTRLKS